jgi:tetratricopeptide (TPR) repeat protein
MIRYIFKNYDSFLEKLRKLFLPTFNNKKSDTVEKNLLGLDEIDMEIKRQKDNLQAKKEINIKFEIQEKIVKLLIKKKVLTSNNKYLDIAYKILYDFSEDRIYEALNYLKTIPEHKLTQNELKDIYSFKAFLYELLDDFIEASQAFKKAISLDNNSETIKEYKEFMNRYQNITKWQKESKKSIYNKKINTIHNIAPIDKLPKIATNLENIARYYARSPKSRTLAKQYFKEVIKIYKKLSLHEEKYLCEYLRVLLEGVEEFMLSAVFLKEAVDILADPKVCVETRLYLLEKIKELKEKKFIKQSKIFN